MTGTIRSVIGATGLAGMLLMAGCGDAPPQTTTTTTETTTATPPSPVAPLGTTTTQTTRSVTVPAQ